MPQSFKNFFTPLSEFLPHLGLVFVFLYFGISALLDPATFGTLWIMPPFDNIIAAVLPIKTFMMLFGSLQILVALAALVGIFRKIAFGLMFLLLIGIIVNLSISLGIFNDVVARDIGLSLVALGLFFKEKSYR